MTTEDVKIKCQSLRKDSSEATSNEELVDYVNFLIKKSKSGHNPITLSDFNTYVSNQ